MKPFMLMIKNHTSCLIRPAVIRRMVTAKEVLPSMMDMMPNVWATVSKSPMCAKFCGGIWLACLQKPSVTARVVSIFAGSTDT
jgi:hypothetical protein